MSRRISTAPEGSGPFSTRSPATATRSGFSEAIAFLTASSAMALRWTSERTMSRVTGPAPAPWRSSQRPFRRDHEAECRLARCFAVDRGDRPAAAEAAPELLHRDFHPKRVARADDALEAAG